MKTFLKVLLVAALLIVAIKFSPIIFLGAIVGVVFAGVLGLVGLTLLIVLLAIALAVALALSPIWVPVLVIMGLVSLFRRDEHPAPPPSAPPAAAAA
jgi:hypothetical protein